MFDQVESAITVREMQPNDLNVWVSMYAELFDMASESACVAEVERILNAPSAYGFVAEASGVALGFAELSIRPFANGCVSKPVPFLEGIWTRETHRKVGVATALLDHIEGFARDAGYTELGSDVLQDNELGLAFHRARGFDETERVVFHRKSL